MFRLRAPPASLAVLVISGCLAFRPQLPRNLARVRATARTEWLQYGTCGEHTLRQCENGHQMLTASDGFQYWTTAYDQRGRLEFEVNGGCMGVMEQFGSSPDCVPERSTLVRDLCDESLDGLESRGFELHLGCATPSPVIISAGETVVELVDGARLRFVVPTAPREPFDVRFDGAPEGVFLRSCSEFNDCVALDAGASIPSLRLSVVSRGKEEPCELLFSRSFLVRADAGVAITK